MELTKGMVDFQAKLCRQHTGMFPYKPLSLSVASSTQMLGSVSVVIISALQGVGLNLNYPAQQNFPTLHREGCQVLAARVAAEGQSKTRGDN